MKAVIKMRKSHSANSIERKALNSIIKNNNKFGRYWKSIFHIHTPASHDFKLISSKDEKWYKQASGLDIYKMCIDNKVFPEEIDIDTFKGEKFKDFVDVKEFLSYLLMADKLVKEEIALVVVTDHNTSIGYKKLKKAMQLLNESKKFKIYPEIFLGIEISCADKLHVVGIFDNKDTIIKDMDIWLNENILSTEEGTFRTSYDVICKILELKGIPYIAHLDTSDALTKNYLSGAYKKKLFEIDEFNFIGISNISNIDRTRKWIENITKKSFNYLLDCDAHSTDELEKNHFWIKGSKRNYQMIKEAVRDYDISIKLDDPIKREQYIKGLYIHKEENDKQSFLSSKNREEFCLSFSESLNCIIGGRGTGKSTILQLLEFALRQTCKGERELEFICRHDWIWILYYYKGNDYLIHLNLPNKNSDENILQYFRKDNSYIYNKKYSFRETEISSFTRKEFLEIYRVDYKNDDIFLYADESQAKLLESFFDTRYSVNELVQTASSDEINHFIYNKMFENHTLENPNKIIKIKKASGLKRLLSNVENIMEIRKNEVHDIIDNFNNTQDKVLRIIYSQNANFYSIPFEKLLEYDINMKKRYYNNYNIFSKDIIEYLYALDSKIGLQELLKLIFAKEFSQINKIVPISDFLQEKSEKLVEEGINFIDKDNELKLIEKVSTSLVQDRNISFIIDYLKTYITEKEEFRLEFNVNSKESSSNNSALFKDVRTLSLGQKVVAMLTFILAYSEYSDDYRPLIIDQPEDNLDNQYIYKNLVKQLRDIKEKRQIIIATHNATIVTNSKAEQVIIMGSDNENGWVELTGYPTEKRVKRQIVNYLEGGVESFKHKCQIYEEVL